MADIFISYSSHDREKAKKLADQLQGLGYSVWMDVSDLDASTRWSTEIAEAIEVCRILALLLSRASLASENVVKELSLAAEKKKHILPIVLEKTKLNPDFEYHLAGLQHTSIDNINAIVRALEHLVASQAHATAEKPPINISDDTRARIAVLPLDDYSPARDNDWFAEGLASELISKLSKLSQLFVVDRLTSREFKDTRLGAKQIASELQVRYLVSGAVRKAGERIQIDITLIDAAQGQTLWDDSYPGIMGDIFAIQDEVATKIAESLKVIFTKDEESNFRKRATENSEAYELGLRAISYVNRNTKQDYLYAIRMCEEAIALDPKFVWACGTLANACLAIHRIYDRSEDWLTKAATAIDNALKLSPNDVTALSSLAILQLRRGDMQEAVATATKAVELAPNNEVVLFQLGYFYDELGEYAKAADAYERSVHLVPSSLDTLYNLALDYHLLGDSGGVERTAKRSFGYFQKYIARHPDDQNKRLRYASLLYFVGRKEECFREMESLLTLPAIDARTYYNAACRYAADGQNQRAVALLGDAVVAGYSDVHRFKTDPDLNPLRDMPEFEVLIKELEEKLTTND